MITWVLKVQKIVTLSITKTKYMAATEAANKILWLISLTNALGQLTYIEWTLNIYRDNQGSIYLIKNPECY